MLTICYLPPKPGHIKKHIIFTTQRSAPGSSFSLRANFGSTHGTILRHFDKHGHRNRDNEIVELLSFNMGIFPWVFCVSWPEVSGCCWWHPRRKAADLDDQPYPTAAELAGSEAEVEESDGFWMASRWGLMFIVI
jgi:hypothetical protein